MSEESDIDRRVKIASLVIEARAAELEGVELLNADNGAIADEYNGIGPEFLSDAIRGKVTRFLSLFEPAALIHDLRFNRGDGSRLDFNFANIEFHSNCLKLARRRYPWWRPLRRFLAENAAFALFKAVGSYLGWVAYRRACARRVAPDARPVASNARDVASNARPVA